MIDWIDVRDRVPNDRRKVLAWGDTPPLPRQPNFKGVTRFNPTADGGKFDIEGGSRFVPWFTKVTHWAEITGPAEPIRKPPPKQQ